MSLNSFHSRSELVVDDQKYIYFDLNQVAENGAGDVSRLPAAKKVLLENLVRFEDGITVTADDIRRVANPNADESDAGEIAYRPARVLMQDFTGVPAVADLAAMRLSRLSAVPGGEPGVEAGMQAFPRLRQLPPRRPCLPA